MLKNIRRSYWLFSGFVGKHLPKILLTAFLTALFLIAIPQVIERLPQGKTKTTIGRVGQFTIRELPLDIQKLISSGLTDIASDGTATPSLALSWQVEDEGQRYVFKLNPQKSWHDDRPFQAADINYTLQGIAIGITDPYTVEFKLNEPFAPFPTIVSTPIFRQTTTLSKILKKSQSELVGTDQFQVKRVKKRGAHLDQLILESSQEKRTYKFYTTEEAAILGFKLGEIDTLEHLANPKDLTAWKNVTVSQTVHLDRYVAVFFNAQDPLLTDKNLRQALTYAIPQKPLDSTRALGPINPNSWAYNPQVKSYDTNLDRAQEIIADIKKENKDFTPSLRLDTPLAYLSLAETIKSAWAQLGVNTDVRVIAFPPQDYQAMIAVHQIPPDPDQYTLWHSTQTATNLTHLKNPKIDKLLEDGRKTIDLKERKEIYQDFQRFLLEESPAAFLFYQTTYDISRK